MLLPSRDAKIPGASFHLEVLRMAHLLLHYGRLMGEPPVNEFHHTHGCVDTGSADQLPNIFQEVDCIQGAS